VKKKMRFLCILVVAFLAAVSAKRPFANELSEEYTFDQYKKHFGKAYSGAEHEERKALFEANLRTILAHNAQESSYRMGVNHMTDWTATELRSLLGYDKALGRHQVRERHRKAAAGELKFPTLPEAPHSVDWRGKGVLTAVKDQGRCGSCWTFASAETIESAWAIATGQLQVVSEQHILSCVENTYHCGGTGGCDGGTAELAFAGLQPTGITSEWVYPYLSWYGNNSDCKWTSRKGHVASWSGYTTLPSNDADSLMSALAAHGPIAVSVDASTWHLYESGVYNGCNQENPDINHAVQLVGYGTDSTTKQDYWVIRNSWTPEFGEEGFIRILRQDKPSCGTDNTPLDGTACEGDDDPVTVCGTCGVLYDSSFVNI
jgi:cathepsin L